MTKPELNYLNLERKFPFSDYLKYCAMASQ